MVRVVVNGLAELQERLDKVERGFNTQDTLDAAGAYVLNRIRTSFLAEEDPFGVPWIPSLAARKRAASGRGGGTGFDTGRLFNSISLARQGNDRVVFTDVEYASDFQDGPPARIFMEVTAEDEAAVQRIIQDRIRLALL